jgi:hypothetical protein
VTSAEGEQGEAFTVAAESGPLEGVSFLVCEGSIAYPLVYVQSNIHQFSFSSLWYGFHLSPFKERRTLKHAICF